MQREVLAVMQRVLGAEHPSTFGTAHNLAASLSNQGKHDEAEMMLREVLAVRKRVLGAQHPYTLITANNLAVSLKRQGSLFLCVRVCIYVLVPALVLLCASVFACVHMMGSHEL